MQKLNIMFEISGVPLLISGNCSIIEKPSTGQNPGVGAGGVSPIPAVGVATNYLIQTDQDFAVDIQWNQTGAVWMLLAGNWVGEVFFELMGPGEAPAVAFQTPLAGSNTIGTQKLQVPISAGQLPAGQYRVTCSLQFYVSGAPKAIAAFEDLGLIKVYDETI